jgi:GTPase SAR1 family protein
LPEPTPEEIYYNLLYKQKNGTKTSLINRLTLSKLGRNIPDLRKAYIKKLIERNPRNISGKRGMKAPTGIFGSTGTFGSNGVFGNFSYGGKFRHTQRKKDKQPKKYYKKTHRKNLKRETRKT